MDWIGTPLHLIEWIHLLRIDRCHSLMDNQCLKTIIIAINSDKPLSLMVPASKFHWKRRVFRTDQKANWISKGYQNRRCQPRNGLKWIKITHPCYITASFKLKKIILFPQSKQWAILIILLPPLVSFNLLISHKLSKLIITLINILTSRELISTNCRNKNSRKVATLMSGAAPRKSLQVKFNLRSWTLRDTLLAKDRQLMK